jgi:hypothetical protein
MKTNRGITAAIAAGALLMNLLALVPLSVLREGSSGNAKRGSI